MHRELLIEAFNKAKDEIGTDITTRLSKHLSDFIVEDSKQPYGERILRDHFNKAIKTPKEKIELKVYAAESLSRYLDYDGFTDFVVKNKMKAEPTTDRFQWLWKKNRIVTVLFSAVLLLAVIYYYSTRQRWMVWQEDHYIEVSFDSEKFQAGVLKLYKEDRIDNFKRIEPNCDYEFFNSDNSVRVWYGKNKNKEYEYFTSLGLHPETGKSLKEITTYIIKKYICD